MRRIRARRRRRAQRTGGSLLALGLATTGVAAGLMWVGFNAPNSIPGRKHYMVSAEFVNADNATAHYRIRMGGRDVGQVLRPRVLHGRAVLDMQLDNSVRPLRASTTVRIRPRSAVGVRFVEITPGRRGRALSDGATIPAAQTSSTVQLDTVLDTLDDRRRRQARTVLSELAGGFADRGGELNEVIARTPPVLADTTTGLSALNDSPGATKTFVRGTEAAASAADPVREDIGRGLAPEQQTLGAIAARDDALRASLNTAPAAFGAIRTGLGAAEPMLRELGRLGAAAESTLRPAPSTFTRVDAMLATARPGLRATPAVLRLADRATAPTLGLLERLDPVLPRISRTVRAAAPLLVELGRRDCDIRRWFDGWRGILTQGVASRDKIGPATSLRLTLLQTPETVGARGVKSPDVLKSPYPAPCAGQP